jgi:hypothetical protein
MKKFFMGTGLMSLAAALGLGLFGRPANATHGTTGSGAPNGGHYSLNLIGTKDKTVPDMTGSNRHVIFVKLDGKTNILLCESGVDAGLGCETLDPETGFQVLDGNGTDGTAVFALPNPDPDGDGTTVYSVFARALGKPGGSSKTTTCATGPGPDGLLGTADDELLCSVISLVLERDPGRSKFDNVSKYLLYIYVDIDGDGDLERAALFDDRLLGYFWEYDNDHLRLAQLRFYECATIVPAPSDPGGAQIDTDCTSGAH